MAQPNDASRDASPLTPPTHTQTPVDATPVLDLLARTFVETVPALVLITSAQGEVEYSNARLLDYCGTNIAGLQGARWVTYIHPEDVKAGERTWRERIEQLAPFSSEYRIRRFDGAFRWYLTQTAPVMGQGGEVRGWLAISMDVHDRREAEERLRQTADDLHRANAVKDEFFGLISHELRTPLTTIYGNAHVLRRAAHLDALAVERAMQDVEQEAVRLQHLVDNLLVIARLDTPASIDTEPVQMGRIVEHAVEDHMAAHPLRTVHVTLQSTGTVCGHRQFIEQVLRILLGNAEKYSASHEPIEVLITERETRALVCVLDRGIGMSTAERARMFERFFRTESAAKLAPGAGLGLAAARKLMDAQQGELWIRPRDGGGTEAGFALPLEKEEDE